MRAGRIALFLLLLAPSVAWASGHALEGVEPIIDAIFVIGGVIEAAVFIWAARLWLGAPRAVWTVRAAAIANLFMASVAADLMEANILFLIPAIASAAMGLLLVWHELKPPTVPDVFSRIEGRVGAAVVSYFVPGFGQILECRPKAAVTQFAAGMISFRPVWIFISFDLFHFAPGQLLRVAFMIIRVYSAFDAIRPRASVPA